MHPTPKPASRVASTLAGAAVLLAGALAGFAACGQKDSGGLSDDGLDAAPGDDATLSGGSGASGDDAFAPSFGDGGGGAQHDDFPGPVLDAPDGGAAAPSNAAALFGPAAQGARSG